MRHPLLFIGLIAATATVSACMTSGPSFDMRKVDQLVPGQSTKADAIALLGVPTSTSAVANDAELLQWMFIMGTPVGGTGRHVAILFDREGRMVRVTHRFEQ